MTTNEQVQKVLERRREAEAWMKIKTPPIPEYYIPEYQKPNKESYVSVLFNSILGV